MIPSRAAKTRAGYSLLEMLLYVAVLAVIVNLSLSLYLTSSRLHHRGERAADRIDTMEAIGREFRHAVHASGTLALTDDTSVRRIELTGRDASSKRTRYVWSYYPEKHVLRTASLKEVDGQYTITAVKTFDRGIEDVRFVPTDNGRTVSIQITVENAGLTNTLPKVQTITASFRQQTGTLSSDERSGT
jgi:Tfp pilus assembly protein FimT